MTTQEFTEEQKNYLQGFAAGSGIARLSLNVIPGVNVRVEANAPTKFQRIPMHLSRIAQDRFHRRREKADK